MIRTLSIFGIILAVASYAQNPSSVERFTAHDPHLVAREDRYWKRTPLQVPDGISLEVSGIMQVSGKRLLVTTRKGEIWWVDGAYEPTPAPKFTLFASGLHEPLGITAAPTGGYYVAQRQEITLVRDSDADGEADTFETVYKVPISGSYHEYAFGPVVKPNGNLLVTLNVAFNSISQSPVPWRGWAIEVSPDGRMRPVAAGLRSPAGHLLTSHGLWLYAENQGEWVGSGHVTEIQDGDFMGHPASLAWSRLPGSQIALDAGQIPATGRPIQELFGKIPNLKRPTVWFPHTILGISTAGMTEDLSQGKFGPYAGHIFVADQGQSKILRMTLENVKGVWQGASYSFKEGFECGVLRLDLSPIGIMFAGETARGWGSVGSKQQGLERLEWTGEVPFDIQEITARPDGFVLKFTRPVEPASALNPDSYAVAGFTYKYHSTYGSPPVSRISCPIRKVELSADRTEVRLAVVCLRRGYIHEIKAGGVRSIQDGESVMHPAAYYTLNEIPDGVRIIPAEPEIELCVSPVPIEATMPSQKHPTTAPKEWANSEGDRTIMLGTLPGLKFDKEELQVKAGERIQLVFRNADDMMHNFVLCAPGRGQSVGSAAMSMGLAGPSRNYVPESDEVLYHTALLEPQSTDRIYFTAPTMPGDYEYICSFPGHAMLMKGVLRVR